MKEVDNLDNHTEQSQETTEAPVLLSRSDLDGVHEAASRLIDELATVPEGDLVGEIVANALKLLRDRTNRGDVSAPAVVSCVAGWSSSHTVNS